MANEAGQVETPSSHLSGRARLVRRVGGAVGALALLAAALVGLGGAAGTAPASASTVNGNPPTLLPYANQRGIFFGAAATGWPDDPRMDPQYGATLSANYNGLTPENAMKWWYTEPAQGTYDFSLADPLIAFAAEHHMHVRGHNLVWGQNNPAWLETGTWTRDQLIQIMHDHIANVVGHFKSAFPGTVTQWDVVNEAIDGDGHLVPNIWQRVIGNDYIALAFQFANQADPSAQLYYNDYGGEGLGTKSDAINWVAAYLKATGVPITGVGLESHFDLYPPAQADIAKNMARLASEGLKVAITEMDVRVPLPAGVLYPANSVQWAQAQIYHDTLATCLAQPACTTFVTWGFTDKFSWIPTAFPGYGWALPFTDQYVHKPAYMGLAVALQGG